MSRILLVSATHLGAEFVSALENGNNVAVHITGGAPWVEGPALEAIEAATGMPATAARWQAVMAAAARKGCTRILFLIPSGAIPVGLLATAVHAAAARPQAVRIVVEQGTRPATMLRELLLGLPNGLSLLHYSVQEALAAHAASAPTEQPQATTAPPPRRAAASHAARWRRLLYGSAAFA